MANNEEKQPKTAINEAQQAQEVTAEPEAQEVISEPQAQDVITSSDKKVIPGGPDPAAGLADYAKIVINEPDPRLNPSSPEFDQELYNKALEEAGGREAMTRSLKEAIQKISDTAREAGAALARNAANAMEGMKIVSSFIGDIVNSEYYKLLKEAVTALQKYATEHREEQEQLQLFYDILEEPQDPELAFYIGEVLDERGETMGELLARIKENGQTQAEAATEILEEARKRLADAKKAAEVIETIEEIRAELPQIVTKQTDKLDYPLDKPNSVIWNLLQASAPDGQLRIDITTTPKGGDIYYGINFAELPAELKITKQLTTFDKRCYVAAASLFQAGNDIVSATQIYKMMGNKGRPGDRDLQQINDSLTKMGTARVYLDNQREIKTAKGYKHFRYDGPLLPFERLSAYINGQLSESAIHLFREPPLMSFARQRKQITTITRELLESPISKTEQNLRIDDYLIERIGHMKNPKSKTPRKMLYATIFDKCGITEKKQKQRAPEKIKKYLTYYKKCGYIRGYKEEADGIKIEL